MCTTTRGISIRSKLAFSLLSSLFMAGTVMATAIPNSLKTVAVSLPNLSNYVKDTAAAIRLGKALFWDTQVGGDGQTACATCHFSAGVDPRTVKPFMSAAPPSAKGSYRLGAIADYTNAVVESREDNKEVGNTIQVK